MSHGTANRCPNMRRLALAAVVLLVATLLALPVVFRRDPVRLSFISYTNEVTGLRTAFLCLSNDSPKRVVFLSDGGVRPYYHLVEYLTLSTNPVTKLVTNYNQDAFFHVTQGSLAPHSGVVFPVMIPQGALNTTIIVNYYPPENLFRDFVEDTQVWLGRKAGRTARTYSNLTLKPPVN
jgi:hypothetical protein